MAWVPIYRFAQPGGGSGGGGGQQGQAGSQILTGALAPALALGNVGDWYFQSNGTVYQKVAVSFGVPAQWQRRANLTGPAGKAGADGRAGAQGIPGGGGSGGTLYTADEATLHLAGTVFSILSTYPGQTSITTLGTVTTCSGMTIAGLLRCAGIGLNTPPIANGNILAALLSNGVSAFNVKRFTDTLPTGSFLEFTDATGADLFVCDITGAVTVGQWKGTQLAAAYVPSLDAITAPAANVAMNSKRLTGLANAVNAQDAVTLDQLQNTQPFKAECQTATTTALAAYTYANGASGVGATITLTVAAILILDGYTPALNDRIVVKNETGGNAPYNGIYTLTTVGTAIIKAVLTRGTDFDEAADGVSGAIAFVQNGTVNGGTSWYCSTFGSITFGTTNISFSQYTGPGMAAGGDLTGTYPNPTVAANAVTNAKAAQMAANTIKGNNTGSTANAADLTVAQVNSLLGTWYKISSQTAATSSSLDFAPTIPAGTTSFLFVLQNILPATAADVLWMRTTANGGSTWDSAAGAYRYCAFGTDEGGASGVAVSSTGDTKAAFMGSTSAVAADGVSGWVDWSSLGSGSVKAMCVWDITFWNNTPTLTNNFGMVGKNSAAAINGVRFLFSTGNIASGTIIMYGRQ